MTLPGTIAAVATPPGRSARAILRLSGPDTRAAITSLMGATPTPRAAPHRLRLSPTLELPCLVLWFTAPRSYTGEDAAEIQIPGNPLLAERVLAALLAVPGVRGAHPGEFTARAFLNGKLSLDQAEAVGSIIAAQNADDLDAARELAKGRTGALHHSWADEAATLLALVEAGVDFTDQEGVVAIEPGALGARLTSLAGAIRRHLDAAGAAEAPDHAPVVAVLGAPNAGKSTLFNALLGRRRAVESPEAGTTRDALRETLDLSRDAPGAGLVTIVDLPGLDAGGRGASDDAAQAGARAHSRGADCVLWCDPSGRFDGPDLPPLRPGCPVIRVRTKADLALGGGARVGGAGGGPQSGSDGSIAVCALDGWHLGSLRRAIADHARAGAGRARVPARHARALHAAAGALDRARAAAPDLREAPEVVAAHLREAADALGELVGRISVEDVLGRVFATFCVGK